MILIFEQNIQPQIDCKYFRFKPMLFKGIWHSRRTWRIGWGIWTLSYYPEPGLKEFFQYASETQWYNK